MADRILIDLGEMQATIDKYEASKEAQMDAVTLMVSAIDKIEWSGVAFNNFQSRFNDLRANLEKSERIMDDAIVELNKVMARMQQAETNVGTIVESIDIGPSEMPI